MGNSTMTEYHASLAAFDERIVARAMRALGENDRPLMAQMTEQTDEARALYWSSELAIATGANFADKRVVRRELSKINELRVAHEHTVTAWQLGLVIAALITIPIAAFVFGF